MLFVNTNLLVSIITIFLTIRGFSDALNLPSSSSSHQSSRIEFIQRAAANLSGYAVVTTNALVANPSQAAANEYSKRMNLPVADLVDIVKRDVTENQFLATGQLTREIYDESATFADEIDIYGLEQWMTGTQKLFVGSGSNVRLLGDVEASTDETEIKFRFEEELMFNIPLVRPVVYLSGTVFLTRDPSSGLLTKYVEKWDQSVSEVLKSAKTFGSK